MICADISINIYAVVNAIRLLKVEKLIDFPAFLEFRVP